ncbi:MAG: hypothetical protein ABR988_17015, partial [Terriglobales bacterium]
MEAIELGFSVAFPTHFFAQKTFLPALRQIAEQAMSQVRAVCSPLRCVQNSCYDLIVAAPMDS